MIPYKYTPDEVVWAKIRGSPWWPAVISSENHVHHNRYKQIMVNFVGDNSYAILSAHKIKNYREGYEEFSRGKGKSLKNSIKIANKIEARKITYKGIFIIIIEAKEKYTMKVKTKNRSEKKILEGKKRISPDESDNFDEIKKSICKVRSPTTFRNRIYLFQNQLQKLRFLKNVKLCYNRYPMKILKIFYQ